MLSEDVRRQIPQRVLDEVYAAVPQAPEARARKRMTNVKVTTIGDVELTEDERTLLAHGLKFIRTPLPLAKNEWIRSVEKAVRTIALRSFFTLNRAIGMREKIAQGEAIPEDKDSIPFFTLPSDGTWNPKDHIGYLLKRTKTSAQNIALIKDRYISLLEDVERRLLKLQPKITRKQRNSQRSNLAPRVNLAIDSLNRNRDIVVMSADKNMGLIVMPTTMAKEVVMVHLQDTETYSEPIETFPVTQLETDLRRIMAKHNISSSKDKLIAKLAKFLTHTIEDGTAGRFYGLAKIHKLTAEQLQQGVPPSTRPIGAAHSLVTTPAAILIDKSLQSAMKSLPSYIPNSMEMVKLLEQSQFPSTAILWTADVKALYPNVPTDSQAIKRVLERAGEADNGALRSAAVNTDALQDLLEWCLHNHYVQGPDRAIRRQLTGLGMGIAFAPAYANIWLATYEESIVNDAMTSGNLCFYRRYIDDLFGVWLGTREQLELFIGDMSNFYPTIKLEGIQIAMPGEVVNFLDLSIRLDIQEDMPTAERYETSVIIRTYQKPLNVYQYIPHYSFHNKKVIEGWPVTEIMRYIRNDTLEADCDSMIKHLQARLQARAYPQRVLDNASITERMSHANRANLLMKGVAANNITDVVLEANKPRPDAPSPVIAFISRWCASWLNGSSTKEQVRELLALYEREIMRTVLSALRVREHQLPPPPRVLFAYRNSDNLNRLLAPARRIDKDEPKVAQPGDAPPVHTM